MNACQPRGHLIGRTSVIRGETQSRTKILESLVILFRREVNLAQSSQSTSRLEQVMILLEEVNRMACHGSSELISRRKCIISLPRQMFSKEIAVGINALLLNPSSSKRVGNHGRKRLQSICLEVSEVIRLCQSIDTKEMIELSDGHFFGCSVYESAATHHIMIVEPLRSICFKIDILSSLLYLSSGRAVLTKIIIIG